MHCNSKNGWYVLLSMWFVLFVTLPGISETLTLLGQWLLHSTCISQQSYDFFWLLASNYSDFPLLSILLFFPNLYFLQGNGESCANLGLQFWNEWNSTHKYIGMDSWTVPFSYYNWSDVLIYILSVFGNVVPVSIAVTSCRTCSFSEYFTHKSLTTKK